MVNPEIINSLSARVEWLIVDVRADLEKHGLAQTFVGHRYVLGLVSPEAVRNIAVMALILLAQQGEHCGHIRHPESRHDGDDRPDWVG